MYNLYKIAIFDILYIKQFGFRNWFLPALFRKNIRFARLPKNIAGIMIDDFRLPAIIFI